MSRSFRIIAIAAMDEGRAIGFQNTLPWSLPEDMKRFAALTSGHVVMMGRKTYDSLPPKWKPLPKRLNLIVSRSPQSPSLGLQWFSSPEEAILWLEEHPESIPGRLLWVIGGEQIYRETQGFWDEVELTLVRGRHKGDAYFPEFEDKFQLQSTDQRSTHTYMRYVRASQS